VTAWRQEPLRRDHDRRGFDCGVVALNEFLRTHARQNAESGGAKTYVAVSEREPIRIAGYYTIGPESFDFRLLPPDLARKLGRYKVPAYLLARLAVSLGHQGRGLGAWLLFAAADRALAASREIGGIGLVIDAKDDTAKRWYERFGAMRLLDEPLRLILPFHVIAAARNSVLSR
jgi:GNAT superfamily N-acetyltransferase